MKNTRKFLGIIILAAAGFAMLACPTGGGGSKNPDGDNLNLAELKVPEGLKSVYLSDIKMTGGGRAARDGGDSSGPGGDTVSSLSYVTSTGQNAPVLFSTSSGKQLVLAVASLEQLGERCIIVTIDGYYEATGTDTIGAYTLGNFMNTSIQSVLIDMKNSKLYDFSDYKARWEGTWTPVRFMEGNIIYTIKGDNNNGVVYKIDLSTASAGSALTAVPMNNGSLMPLYRLNLPYTINNKLISSSGEWNKYYVLDVSGTKSPELFKQPLEITYQQIDLFRCNNSLIWDLADKLWAFYYNDSGGYSIAKVSIDDKGQCTFTDAIEKLTGVDFSNDVFQYSNGYAQARVYTFNAAGMGSTIAGEYYDGDNDIKRMQSYLNTGVVTFGIKGFIKLIQKADGIDVEAVELDALPSTAQQDPNSIVGKSVISSNNYLFYLENKKIMRLELAANKIPQQVYENSGLMDSTSARGRDLLTASGRKVIFYQYAPGSATEIHTYSLDMYNPTAKPELLATSDVQARSIVELNF